MTYPNLIQCEVVEYPNVDVLAVNQTLPFRDACFDAVLSLDVLEHVDQPFDCAAEILRVLKPGGRLYCNVPFLQREHGYPHHYFGMTRMGLLRLFGDQINVDQHRVPASGHPIWALWMMLQTYRDGLPQELRTDFHQLRVADILDKNPAEWMKEPIFQALSEEARWKIATTTSLIATKRSAGN
ncbi:MAG: methyltransferase domain-containing protein [Lysobacterales bacterium]